MDCTISSDTQDFLNTNPMTVNVAPGFFGITDWVFGGKIGNNAADGYLGDGSGQSGTYDISGVGLLNAVSDIMLVTKSGAGTSLVGYLLGSDPGSKVGSWTTPYTKPAFSFPGNNPKNVSHISVYYSGILAVSAPANLLVYLTGLLGLGILARNRRQG